MANNNSVQIAAVAAKTPISANESHGRIRAAYFSCVVPTVGIADTMTLCTIPKGARVLSGSLHLTVAQGATATMAIGISGATGKYRAAAITNATTRFTFADTSATHGLETTVEETIIATNAAATWTAATMTGYIEYVVD
jgi:hypothetical protein